MFDSVCGYPTLFLVSLFVFRHYWWRSLFTKASNVLMFVSVGPSVCGLCGGCVDLLPSGVSLVGGNLTSSMCVGVFQFVCFLS